MSDFDLKEMEKLLKEMRSETDDHRPDGEQSIRIPGFDAYYPSYLSGGAPISESKIGKLEPSS